VKRAAAGPRAALRTELRARRAALPAANRSAAATRILAALARSPWLRPGREVALYVATGHEVPTAALLRLALARGCHVCLPRISDYGAMRMQLLRWRGGTLVRNRHGIAEPRGSSVVTPQRLALAVVPVVAFDARGTRLGSGAGYYDRLFALRLQRSGPPVIIGLAFEAQRCRLLPRGRHDVPLDAVVTEAGLLPF
jgi:5-formyltetrahydrofolate cyclo-ligase